MLHSLPVVQPAPSVSSLARLRLTRPGKKIPSQHRQVSVTPVAMASPLPADPAKTRVGWIGTGVMGSSMCGHIIDAGYNCTVFNRTASKADGLVAKGAVFASNPMEVAQRSDVVFLIVGFPEDVQETVLGPKGVLAGLAPGGVVVDMTTSNPSLAREIAAAAAAKGVVAIDAPVSGGDAGARNAALSIMCGGPADAIESVRPLFEKMGRVNVLGGPGAGQSCKMANQVTIATTMVGLCEGIIYAYKAGLDVDAYLAAIRNGAAGSKSLELYAPRLRKRDFAPGFYVKHFVKDLGIALEESRKMGIALPGLALAQQLYVSLMAHGDGDLGTQALQLALERMNNTTVPAGEQQAGQ